MFVSKVDLVIEFYMFSTTQSVAIDHVTVSEPVQKGPTNTPQINRQKLPADGKNKRLSLKVFNSGENYPISVTTFKFL